MRGEMSGIGSGIARSRSGKGALSPSQVVTATKAGSTKVRTVKDEKTGSLSAYEEARLANIARNTQVLAGLGINTETSAIALAATKQKCFAKPEKRAREPREPIRRSTRGKDADGKTIEPLVVEEPVEEHVAPTGPIEIREGGGSDLSTFADRLQHLASTPEASVATNTTINYSELTLGDDSRCPLARHAPRVKVVKERIFSMAFHPFAPLVVAGDKWGQVGFLDLGQEKEAARIFSFAPHARPVAALQHAADGQRLFSGSYDGTVRRFDYTSGTFELIFQDKEDMLCHLCLSCDQTRVLVAGNGGDVYVLDPRINSARASQVLDVHDRKVASVDGHPRDCNVFATASNDQTVKIWDARKVSKSKPLHLLQHSLAVTGAYFSPSSPFSVVTTCNDNLLRFWTPEDQAASVVHVKHNNNTGRYITNFRAVWDPKCSVVLIGNMNKKVDVLDGQGRELASISHEQCSAIPAVNVAHPSLALIASGNGSGYINVWAPP
jgi:WD repeat-containing protein 76